MSSTITTLTDEADALLAVCEAALATTDAGVPDRVFLSPSPPIWDCCPFLNVYVAGLREETTSPISPIAETALRGKFGNVILATYVITAVRCAPVPAGLNGLPSVADIQASAIEVEQDGWALWNGIRHAHADGVIFDRCIGVHFDGGSPIAEQGGCVGWQFQIRASIPGIPNS